MNKITLNIHNTILRIQTDNLEFFDFIKKDMYYFVSDTKRNTTINSNIFFTKQYKNVDFNNFNKIGANSYINNEILIYKDIDFIIEAYYEKNSIVLNCFIHNKNTIKRQTKNIIKTILGRKVEKNYAFLHIVRRLIIFPSFYYMENFKHMHVMHASAFTFKDKTFVLAGLANIGKSTNSLVSTFDFDGKFLSDNFLIYDYSKVYSFPELIRVSDETMNMIQNSKKLGKHKYTRGHRKLYEIDKQYINDNSNVDILIFPSLSSKFKIERIDLEYAIELILSSNEYVQEFHNIDFISMFNRIHKSSYSPHIDKVKVLKELLKDTKLFIVAFDKNKNPKLNMESIYEHTICK
ncbi:hypothetical protein HOK00_00175 [bacterium]|jgi:hypothetical protein|nr:hypothetical protein [bacterium]